jgi:hypothetical protein
MNNKRIISQIKDVYSEIYILERRRVEINKSLNKYNKQLKALLNFIRKEG